MNPVNYPGVMNAPGQALPCVHMIICCPLATSTSLPRGKLKVITKLSEFLYFSHKLLQRRNFKHVYPFLVLSGTFFEKFISNSNNEHAQVYSFPGATLAFYSHRVKLPRQGGLPVSRSCPWATKISCEQLQVSDRAPRQS